jgi:alpha-ketoglutarate-dependent taurine dioxygenase
MTKKAANAVRCPPSISGPRALNAVLHSAIEQPFSLERPQDYLRWRERKLARYPHRAEDLIVEVRDPRALRDSEAAQIRRVCAAANMAVYASPLAGVADKDIVQRLGARLGLARLQANPLADEDGITSLEVAAEKSGRGYIPYSNRRLLWHTDGYYNPPESRIRAFLLHCVRPAAAGGKNRVLDPEIAYILLRDADPRYVAALSAPDAMTVPANEEDPAAQRAAQAGPVFSFEDGALHMRYTARTRSIAWRADSATQDAVQRLREILDSDSPYVFKLRLAGGQGLVCNNVLHDRSEFTDAPDAGRLVYRARYADRIAPA